MSASGESLVVRAMRSEDLNEVMAVDAECLPRAWSERIWREEIASPFGPSLVLEEGGEIIGQVGLKRVGEELHVTTLAVRPEHRRRGCARVLIETAIDLHPDTRRIHLEVRPSNTGARALYETLGFVVNGVRSRYYGDEDALLMTLDLPLIRDASRAPFARPGGGATPRAARKASARTAPGSDTPES